MKKNKKTIQIIVVCLVVLGSLFYLYSKGTYTSYETLTNGKITPKIAKWNIKVDGIEVTTSDVVTIGLSNINWVSNNAVAAKAVPGSHGFATVKIDPMDTDVSIKYTLEIIDKNVDNNKFLEISNINNSTNSLIQTGENTYVGVITLDELKNKTITTLTFDVLWPLGDDVDPYSDEVNSSSNFLEINFSVEQYKGEVITPYTTG
ncbi:MAG: hypothetical protein UE699_06820 [Bacilli bacterium]|nr:hypothetical protein [Mycoplasmatota bacterium]MDD6263788.1 hypothetical protein [bacterium]MDD6941459.1 hypothetical protein [bacterium]MDY2696982.1 hypothetical protein [Bacilli bacterium]MEE0015373.1 hypothetical protein [Bacilli bacterium]